jgi:nucleotide-binding universal stress UspA family protein
MAESEVLSRTVTATLASPHPLADIDPVQERKTRQQQAPVIVGVDGSTASMQAVELGAGEAARRRATLLLVHGNRDDHGDARAGPRFADTSADGRAMLADIERHTHARHRSLRIRSAVVAGSGGGALVELSRLAAVVVVGARGAGGFTGLRLGSVSTQVAMYAHAPVIVVRPIQAGTGPNAPVMIGLDAAASSSRTLAYACEEAVARTAPLVVLRTRDELSCGDGMSTHHGFEPVGSSFDGSHPLGKALARWRARHPELVVREVFVSSADPAGMLIEAGREASLLVMGGRGWHLVGGRPPGCVIHTVVAYASCHVAIVR